MWIWQESFNGFVQVNATVWCSLRIHAYKSLSVFSIKSAQQAVSACEFYINFLKLLIVFASRFQVLKVDGAYVAVKFPGTSTNTNCPNSSGPDADPSSLLQDCRLLRIDELQVCTGVPSEFWGGPLSSLEWEQNSHCCWQVVKTGGTPKVPDCFQRAPKKLCIPEKTEILAVNVDSKGEGFHLSSSRVLPTGIGGGCWWLDKFFPWHVAQSSETWLNLRTAVEKWLVMCESFLLLFVFVPFKGVHAVLKTGNWVRYCIFDLATGKAEQENNFPTSSIAFLGQNERNVAIFTAGQVRASFSSLRIDKRLASLCHVGK